MNKKGMIIGIIAALLLIGGVSIFIHNKKDVVIQNDVEGDARLAVEDRARK